jgi:hypothetical protein
MILLIVTSSHCGACKAFKGESDILPFNTQWNGRKNKAIANIGKFEYNFASFMNFLNTVPNSKIVFLELEPIPPRGSRAASISIFTLSNMDEGTYKARGQYYVKQVTVKPSSTRKTSKRVSYVAAGSVMTLPDSNLEEDWDATVGTLVPYSQILRGTAFFPQVMIFDNTMWNESISDPETPLYRRYYGMETNETPPFAPVPKYHPSNGQLDLDYSTPLLTFVTDLSKNSGLIPASLRVSKAADPVPVIEVKEVSLSEVVPYSRNRRRV